MTNDVFISYSHEDKTWLERLQKMLKPLLKNNPISVWDDTQIRAGAKWKDEIEKALNNARVAVLLVSDNFLASDFIGDKEVPHLLEAAQKKGLAILWVLISDCLWRETEIANYQAVQRPPVPLDSLEESEVKTALRTVCEEIKRALSPAPPPVQPPLPQVNISPQANIGTQPPPVPPPVQPLPANFAGTWVSPDGSWSVVTQNGNAILAQMYMNLFGIPTNVGSGQGMVVGNQAVLDFMDMYGIGGRSEIILSPDGNTITGTARYNNGIVSNVYATRSMT
ncbi:MAG: toll/interleukin-1 receptor domain-containing protein [Chloroflexi bacterium]|nr:toll/interleukin-1 receptor domain-containing protein [Chloroflexota bacterium]